MLGDRPRRAHRRAAPRSFDEAWRIQRELVAPDRQHPDLPALPYLASGRGRRASIQLQRLAGNTAVTRLIEAQRTAEEREGDCGCGGCASCGGATVSRQTNVPVVQRQPEGEDPWARRPSPSPQPAPSGRSAGGVRYDVKEENVQVPAAGQLEGLLGLPPDSVPPGSLANPDFLMSLLANTPGAQASRLEEMSGVPDDVVAAVPEGKVVEVASDDLLGIPATDGGSDSTVRDVHAGVRGADQAISRDLARFGYNAAGPNAIGIVAFPQSRLVRFATDPKLKSLTTPAPWLPESRIVLGHTAVYVRIDGQIRLIRSYAPVSLVEAAVNFGAVRSGTGGVPAQIIDHLGAPHPPGGRMFDITSGRSIEYAVPKDLAARFAGTLPEGGPLPGQLYTAQPEVAATLGQNTRLCNGRNCVHWAVGEVERELKAPVGRGGQSVVDMGGADRARQGKMQDLVTPGRTPPDPVKLPDGQTVNPKLGQMPTHVKIFKYGGRVFGVVSYGLSIYRIANAPAGHEAEVIFEEIGGHGGAIAGASAGAAGCIALAPGTAGLSLLACGVIGALGGTKIGAAVGRGIGGAFDNLLNSPRIVAAALTQAAEILGQLGDAAGAIARAPATMLGQNLIELHAQLEPANWDVRYLPPALVSDMRTAGQAVWSRLGNLDMDGLLGMVDKSIEALGVPGDVAGRLARGVSDIARRNGQDYLVITPDELLRLKPLEFAATLKKWNLTFVQDPGYISGSGGRYENEGELRFHLYPILQSRASINPGNWDVDGIPATRSDDGTDYAVPLDVERVGTIVWAHLGKLDEQYFKERKDRTLPGHGVPDSLLETVADGLTELKQPGPLTTTPEVLRQLTPEGFVQYLIDWNFGFKYKHPPGQVAETSLRWVRAGFKPW